jgi:hypothetical protein
MADQQPQSMQQYDPAMYGYMPPSQVIKYQNTLELIETEKLMRSLECKMGAYQPIVDKGITIYKRISGKKPIYTDDFIDKITELILFFCNVVTAQVDWTKEEINQRLFNTHVDIILLFTVRSKYHYICSKDWDNILSVHKQREEKTFIEDNKPVKRYVSGWYKHLQRDWNENSPVNLTMLDIIAKTNDDAERVAWNNILEKQIFIILDSSLRRSMGGLTLKHHQMTVNVQKHEYKEDRIKTGLEKGIDNIKGGQENG